MAGEIGVEPIWGFLPQINSLLPYQLGYSPTTWWVHRDLNPDGSP